MTTSITVPMKQINERIAEGGIVFLDGATGSELQRRGAPMHPMAWCAIATESHPQVLCQIHKDYINAGADVITANTFATSRHVLDSIGLSDKFESLNRLAVEVAHKARAEANAGRPILVAGSMAHIRPGDSATWAHETISLSKLRDDFSAMATLLKDCGCDLIMAEMMMDPERAAIVIEAAKETGLPLWVGLSAKYDNHGKLVTNDTEGLPFDEVLGPIVAAGGDLFGIMHSNSLVLSAALTALRRHWDGPLSAYPDLLLDVREGPHRKFGDMSDPQFADYCAQWVRDGVQVIGGCCGFSVSHIKEMVSSLGGTRAA